MIILQIEHKVPNYEGWKRAFDSDPIDRKKSKVIQYRIFRPVDDPNYVILDLEFKSMIDAESALVALRKLWGQVDGKLIQGPQTRMLEQVEQNLY